jgi:hypothetical protein
MVSHPILLSQFAQTVVLAVMAEIAVEASNPG